MKHKIFYGDIHNHNACGYGVGSMQRSIEIARSHLDFFAFTGHSSWHDMEPMEGGREKHWLKGFEKLQNGWKDVQNQIATANENGRFVALLGFEWHSNAYGDHCVIFPDDHREMVAPDSIEELRDFCLERNALMIPHHLAYPTGRRGVNWNVFDPVCSPIVEVYSEHGNSEEDRGPYPFFNHSFGGRMSANTIKAALDNGLRFGFYASSDSHNGFPGAYGEGVTGLLAEDLSRESVFEAIRARRTYALTGDRIEIDFSANGQVMGSVLKACKKLDIRYDIQGRDEIEVVELILNGEVIHRDYPNLTATAPSDIEQLRIEWGWGPWGDLALDRIADWNFDLELVNAQIKNTWPCWQSGPFSEEKRHRLKSVSDSHLSISSYTSRKGAYRQNPNQSVVIELASGTDAELKIDLRSPAAQSFKFSLASLRKESAFAPTGPFPKESMLVHRVLPQSESKLIGGKELVLDSSRSHYAYIRVKQKNGHMAWTSPVFIESDS